MANQIIFFLMTTNAYQKGHGSVRSQLRLCTLHNCLCGSHTKCNNSSEIIQSEKEDSKTLLQNAPNASHLSHLFLQSFWVLLLLSVIQFFKMETDFLPFCEWIDFSFLVGFLLFCGTYQHKIVNMNNFIFKFSSLSFS